MPSSSIIYSVANDLATPLITYYNPEIVKLGISVGKSLRKSSTTSKDTKDTDKVSSKPAPPVNLNNTKDTDKVSSKPATLDAYVFLDDKQKGKQIGSKLNDTQAKQQDTKQNTQQKGKGNNTQTKTYAIIGVILFLIIILFYLV